jgi:hypothetical protein
VPESKARRGKIKARRGEILFIQLVFLACVPSLCTELVYPACEKQRSGDTKATEVEAHATKGEFTHHAGDGALHDIVVGVVEARLLPLVVLRGGVVRGVVEGVPASLLLRERETRGGLPPHQGVIHLRGGETKARKVKSRQESWDKSEKGETKTREGR